MGTMKESRTDNQATKAVMSMARSYDVLNRYLELELAKYGSSPTRFGVMNALIVNGGTMTPTAISKWIFRAKHTITSMLRALEGIGYIERDPSPKDRRSVNINVTKKGWKATESMIPRAEEMSQRVISSFSEEELKTLLNLLKRLREGLMKEIETP